MTPHQISLITDPATRAQEANGFLTRGRDALAQVKEMRDSAVVDLLVEGRSQREVAKVAGISPATVAGIAREREITVERVAKRGQ